MWDGPPRQAAAANFSQHSQDYDLTLQNSADPGRSLLEARHLPIETPGGGTEDRMAKAPTPSRQQITVIGAPRAALRDFYHLFLRARWSVAIAGIVASYVALNAAFASAYLCTGGIANARPGSFFDAFCFSIQTMGTIGYGAMFPTGGPANVLMIVESVTSLLVSAVATGLVFAKFSRSTARVAFSETAVIGPMDGVPTLMMRIGNERGNLILEATIRVSLIRTETTREGVHFYRMYDLALTRERSPAMNRSWTVLHPIVPGSPLLGATPESVAKDEVELLVTVVGVDDTSMQPVHARHRYHDDEILWGARHADILNEQEDGTLVLDMRRFHKVVATEPIAGFPYPRADVEDAISRGDASDRALPSG
jgi:inward rectifier potassium channel